MSIYWLPAGFGVIVFGMCVFAHWYTKWYFNKYCIDLNHTRCDGECYDCGKLVKGIKWPP